MPTAGLGKPHDICVREATAKDLSAIVALLAGDTLGEAREVSGGELDPAYVAAFQEIDACRTAMILLAVSGNSIVGCLQLNFIANLSLTGTRRGQIEGVRTTKDLRGKGIGRLLINEAIEICRAHSCGLLQLTTNRIRKDAVAFYEKCGFEPSHIGFKMTL